MSASIAMFGSLNVHVGERTLGPKDFMGRKPKQLLEILVLHEGRPVPKDQLAEKLWGDGLPVNFSASLEHYVSLLRKRLAPGGRPNASLIRTVHGGYRFEPSEAEVDTFAFDRVYDRHVAGVATRDELDQAVSLVRGELLEDEPYADWAASARAHYSQRHVEILGAAALAALAEGDGVRGAELAAAAVTRDAYAESAHRLLMLAHYQLGRQGDALADFDRCRRNLCDELGVDPLPLTTRLHAAILSQAPAAELLEEYAGAPRAQVRAGSVATQIPPQRSTPDARVPFVGRSADLARLHAEVVKASGRRMPVVLIDGQLGAGKTRMLEELGATIRDRKVVSLTATVAEHAIAGSSIAHLLTALCDRDARLIGTLETLSTTWDDNPGRRAAVAGQIAALIGDQDPFVVLYDNAELIDPVSAQLFACLSLALPASAGALVFACRSGHLNGDHALTHLPDLTRLHLGPLCAETLDSFGIEGLHARTGGLPLFVAGELALTGSGPGTGSDDALERFRRLGDRRYRMLVVAAVFLGSIMPEPLARMLGSDPVSVVDDLEWLCGLQLLQVDGDGFVFSNDAVRDLLRGTVSPARRRLLLSNTRAGDERGERRHVNRLMAASQNRRSGRPDRRADDRRIPVLQPIPHLPELAKFAEMAELAELAELTEEVRASATAG